MDDRAAHPRRTLARAGKASLLAAALASATTLGACASASLDQDVRLAIGRGEWGRAKGALARGLSPDREDRAYLLDRMRLLIATLADGDPRSGEEVANQAFSLLRVQGLNADRTTASVVLSEGVKIWKGEPFEQAMSYHYIALQKAMLGEWGNARAAANSALFLLRDFGENEKGQRLSTLEIAQRAQARGEDYLDKGYAAVETNFALGYLMSGVANRALGRDDEATDFFRKAARVDPGLEMLAEELRTGTYDTVLVVDFGRGPRKESYGPDNALARFAPATDSDRRALGVAVSGDAGDAWRGSFPPACDVNEMARSHMWNNLEDVRAAKSALGDLLLQGGLITAASANQRNDDARQNQQIIGLAVAAIGALMKSTASADLRHLELLPQRVYVVPLPLAGRSGEVTLSLGGEATMVLRGLSAPPAGQLQVRYVRLSGNDAWAAGGAVLYSNEYYDERVPGDDLPYILGGRCVRPPTPETLRRYQRAGNLAGLTPTDLENLYRGEGIALSLEDARGWPRTHVLEGGDSLVCPLPGSAGYARLFGREHPPYRARSKAVKDLRQWLATHGADERKGD